eukprot:gnl/TRDRNA2_/TRDRNA2_184234_c0_seq1.p1 gnl/TRDRNA2_/TRDRNA2_184234_c0~~gnl/TRDRNA2_/TRDRNA2_184234_c0_seq1.p1  ORF type:complete len:127 (+),score=4.19 gnl/TRDRNA2_/TRDRNA2_184234_c0_seq1:50-430(+)
MPSQAMAFHVQYTQTYAAHTSPRVVHPYSQQTYAVPITSNTAIAQSCVSWEPKVSPGNAMNPGAQHLIKFDRAPAWQREMSLGNSSSASTDAGDDAAEPNESPHTRSSRQSQKPRRKLRMFFGRKR